MAIFYWHRLSPAVMPLVVLQRSLQRSKKRKREKKRREVGKMESPLPPQRKT